MIREGDTLRIVATGEIVFAAICYDEELVVEHATANESVMRQSWLGYEDVEYVEEV